MRGIRRVAVLCSLLVLPQTAKAQPRMSLDSNVELIATEPCEAILEVDALSVRITGRISVELTRTTADRDSGLVQVRALNVVFFSIPQRLLAGRLPVTKPLGALGLALIPSRDRPLRYVEGDSVLAGRVMLLADAPFLDLLPSAVPADSLSDFTVWERITMRGELRVTFHDSLQASGSGLQRLRADLELGLVVDPVIHPPAPVPEFSIQIQKVSPFMLETSWGLHLVGVRRLCIQPVRFVRYFFCWDPVGFPAFVMQFTGDGLDFGMPQVLEQWRKCNIVFDVKDWITLPAEDYWALSIDESITLGQDGPDDQNCVEVFFVHDFEPDPNMYGWSFMRGKGSENAKIFVSEANTRGGVDRTSLAHEIGHVLNLCHPQGCTGNHYPGSTGTLMCMSFEMNDNPQINSCENCTHISNPMLEPGWSFGPKGRPDCFESSDCGPCPPIPPQ